MPDILTLNRSLFAEVTPAGAYYAVASAHLDSARKMLIRLLTEGTNRPPSEEQLMAWSELGSPDDAVQLLYRLQRLDFVRGTETPKRMPQGSLESILPNLLASLSSTGRSILADDSGFYLVTSGFYHEAAVEIAALAGDILTMSNRHALLLKNNLNINSNAWAIMDPAGQSELGFFPMYMGNQSFVLIIDGAPRLQGDEFVTLVQALSYRYG
ncbi:MAG: roadblock/LC7 domain-containing protein [Burkholderiales bacterium]|nr:roadblock/LC7 domain-containing protein [Burkholderiales bacterium]